MIPNDVTTGSIGKTVITSFWQPDPPVSHQPSSPSCQHVYGVAPIVCNHAGHRDGQHDILRLSMERTQYETWGMWYAYLHVGAWGHMGEHRTHRLVAAFKAVWNLVVFRVFYCRHEDGCVDERHWHERLSWGPDGFGKGW